MDLDLTGRTALVTGSSGGVGEAIARRLAAEGCRVLVHGRDRERVASVVEDLRSAGGNAEAVIADLEDPGAFDTVVSAVERTEVTIVVANVGPFHEGSWDAVDPAAWSSVFATNVTATATLISRVLPTLRSAGWGRVITVGSRATVTPVTTMVEYSAAKAAVVNLTVGLAAHLADSGVTANCVAPGVILTPSLKRMFLDRSDSGEAAWEDMEKDVTADYAPNPTGRLGRPEDVAAAVAFVASPLADYINGAVLRVDGGITGAV